MARRSISKVGWSYLSGMASSQLRGTKKPGTENWGQTPILRPRFLFIRDTSIAGVFHQPDVFRQSSASRFVRRHFPGFAAFCQFLIRQIDTDQIFSGIDADAISAADQGNG